MKTQTDRAPAVALGAGNQFRAMGSAIGLAIVGSVFNDYVLSRLELLGFNEAHTGTFRASMLQASAATSPAQQQAIRIILTQGYKRQMWTLCAFGAAQVPAALLMWAKEQILAAPKK